MYKINYRGKDINKIMARQKVKNEISFKEIKQKNDAAEKYNNILINPSELSSETSNSETKETRYKVGYCWDGS